MKVAQIVLLLVLSQQCCTVLSAGSLKMELLGGKKKCIGQDLDEGDEATFTISAQSSVAGEILSIAISDPEDAMVFDEKITVSDGLKNKVIGLAITSSGVHEMCFKHHGNGEQAIAVSFGIDLKTKRSLSGVDPSKRVGKAEIPSLESELLAAEESLNDISREIEFARKQEILLTQATESTGSRVQWFSVFSMIILFITSLWQIIYLRHFFTSKKIL